MGARALKTPAAGAPEALRSRASRGSCRAARRASQASPQAAGAALAAHGAAVAAAASGRLRRCCRLRRSLAASAAASLRRQFPEMLAHQLRVLDIDELECVFFSVTPISGKIVDQHFGLDLELARQLVNSNLIGSAIQLLFFSDLSQYSAFLSVIFVSILLLRRR